jgi:hypothetical protein
VQSSTGCYFLELDTFPDFCDYSVTLVNPDTTVRKNVASPRELCAEIRRFRFRHEIDTESKALLRLIKIGLEAEEALAASKEAAA